MECGILLLTNSADKNMLQEAPKHSLLASTYFIHEKCYSLSMEYLKKFSLISRQLELSNINVLHIDQEKVLNLMKMDEF